MEQPNTPKKQQVSIVKIFWFFFGGSIVFFFYTAYTTLRGRGEEVVFRAEDLSDPTLLGAGLFSLLLIGLAYAKLPKAMNDPKAHGIVVKLIQYASAEMASVLGLVLSLTTGNILHAGALSGLALLGMALFYPKKVV